MFCLNCQTLFSLFHVSTPSPFYPGMCQLRFIQMPSVLYPPEINSKYAEELKETLRPLWRVKQSNKTWRNELILVFLRSETQIIYNLIYF